MSNSRQQAHSCNSNAVQKKMVLFINLPGKGLTQETGGMDAPSHGLLLSIISLYQFCFVCWQEKFSYLQRWLICWGILQHHGERKFCTWLLSKRSVASGLELVSLCRFWQSINQLMISPVDWHFLFTSPCFRTFLVDPCILQALGYTLRPLKNGCCYLCYFPMLKSIWRLVQRVNTIE